MSPRVLVDMRVGQPAEGTGLARAAWSLLHALADRRRGAYLIAGAGPWTACAGTPHAVPLPFDIPVGDHGRGEMWIGALSALYEADAILSTYHPLPDTPLPRALIIYDLLALRHPEWFADARVVRFFDRTLRESARRADRIIVATEVVRGDVVDLYGVPPDRVTVVPLAPVLPVGRSADHDELDDDALRALGICRPFFLSVATLEPRKNLIRLIEAFAAAAARADDAWPHLVLVGRLGWKWHEIIDASTRTDRVHVAGYVGDEVLASLLRNAIAFVFPSLDEGFGLPVLEAMGCGCPVLTSDVPVLREVAGDAAAFVNPLDVDGLASGLEAIARDEAYRGLLAQRGRARVAQFSWSRTAAGVEDVLASIL